jgi:hypothetical protein
MRVFAPTSKRSPWRRSASCASHLGVEGLTLTQPSPLEGEGIRN